MKIDIHATRLIDLNGNALTWPAATWLLESSSSEENTALKSTGVMSGSPEISPWWLKSVRKLQEPNSWETPFVDETYLLVFEHIKNGRKNGRNAAILILILIVFVVVGQAPGRLGKIPSIAKETAVFQQKTVAFQGQFPTISAFVNRKDLRGKATNCRRGTSPGSEGPAHLSCKIHHFQCKVHRVLVQNPPCLAQNRAHRLTILAARSSCALSHRLSPWHFSMPSSAHLYQKRWILW